MLATCYSASAQPTTTIDVSPAPDPSGWYTTGNPIISFTCTPSTHSCDKTYWCIDKNNNCNPTNEFTTATTIRIIDFGENFVRFYSTDESGASETVKSESVKLDPEDPELYLNQSYVSLSDNITGNATDPHSGVETIRYAYNTSTALGWSPFLPVPITPGNTVDFNFDPSTTLPDNRVYRIAVVAGDVAGNYVSQQTRLYQTDMDPPEIAKTFQGTAGNNGWWLSTTNVILECQDNRGCSELSDCKYTLPDPVCTPTPVPLFTSHFIQASTNGKNYIIAEAEDVSGFTTSESIEVFIDKTIP